MPRTRIQIEAEAREVAAEMQRTRNELLRTQRSLEGLTRRAERYNRQVRSIVTNMTSLRTVAIGVAAAVGGAFVIRGLADSAAEMSFFAQNVGLTAEELQRLEFAFMQFSIAQEEGRGILRAFTARLVEAGREGSEASRRFEEVGINIRDGLGNIAPTRELLGRIADAVQRAGSQAQRSAILFAAFGEQGVRLQSAFREGNSELVRLGDRAESIGAVLQDELVDAGHELSDAFGEASIVFVRQFQAAILENADTIRNALENITSGLPEAIRAIGSAISFTIENVNVLAGALGALFAVGFLTRIYQFAAAFGAARTALLGAAGAATAFSAALSFTTLGLSALAILGGSLAFQAIFRRLTQGAEDAQELADQIDRLNSGLRETEQIGLELQLRAQLNQLIEIREEYDNLLDSQFMLIGAQEELARIAGTLGIPALSEASRRLSEALGQTNIEVINAAREGFLQSINQAIDLINLALSRLNRRVGEVVSESTIDFDDFLPEDDVTIPIQLTFDSDAFNSEVDRQLQIVSGLSERFNQAFEITPAIQRALESAGREAALVARSLRTVEPGIDIFSIGAFEDEIEDFAQRRADFQERLLQEVSPLLSEITQESDEIENSLTSVQVALGNMAQSAAQAFAEMVLGARSAGEILESLLSSVANLLLQLTFLQTLSAIFPSVFSANVLGLNFAQSGGVFSGPTVVGEAGPELLNLPPGSRVTSNADLMRMLGGGGRGDVNIYGVQDESTIRRVVMELLPEIQAHIRATELQPGQLRPALSEGRL